MSSQISEDFKQQYFDTASMLSMMSTTSKDTVSLGTDVINQAYKAHHGFDVLDDDVLDDIVEYIPQITKFEVHVCGLRFMRTDFMRTEGGYNMSNYQVVDERKYQLARL